MSTRSGKRIHSSFHENPQKADVDHVAQSENKSKSRRCKENVQVLSVSAMKAKKRSNYVSYPTDDEVASDAVDSKAEGAKPTRLLRKNALREQNNIASSTENSDTHIETLKPIRITRRTRKFAEDVESAQENLNQVEEVIIETTNPKKDKKKRKSKLEEAIELASKKKSKKKVKKNKRSGSMVVEDIVPQNGEKDNKGNVSTDSFHSAAGSPLKHTGDNETRTMSPVHSNHVTLSETTLINGEIEDKPSNRQTRSTNRQSNIEISENQPQNDLKVFRKRKSSIIDSDTTAACTELENEELDATLTNSSKKRKSSIRSTAPKKSADKISEDGIKNSTFDLEDLERRKSAIKALINTTYEKTGSPKIGSEYLSDINTIKHDESTSISKMSTPKSNLNSTYEKTESEPIQLTNVFDKETPVLNTTFEKDNPVIENVSRKSAIINTTYEKEIDSGTSNTRRSSLRNATLEKDISTEDQSESEISSKNKRKSTQTQKQSTVLNSTFDKNEKLNTTFEKDKNLNLTLENDKNLNSTFDKDKNLDITFDKNSKCSLISSDNSNITLDKSEVSRISITSDDSKDNIMNTTPVLIESSLDESRINTAKRTSKTDESKTKLTSPLEREPISLKVPTTPLIREGTFTKESENEPQVVAPRTPTRKMSLPSPGCTPFPSHSVSKHMLNVTRSLEKSRRSSLAEPAPRTTRVMFCSPVNNPVVVEQQRRKVIKSNLKGSNKSFVFEDEGESGRRSAGRKRSYTHSDAEEARAKRNRLADGAHSLSRPARPRTFSATGKLPDPVTPSKKATPKKPEAKISRTKLPNFAALHKREFAKMESLDQCQERKARRAKQLLTPTGSVTVLERSPKDAAETKPSEDKSSNPDKPDSKDVEKRSKDAKKLDTPVKSVPTLRSLNPGYSRFGFKLNCDVNPFNVTKNDGDNSQMLSSKKKSVKKDFTRPLKELRGLKRQATVVSLPSLAGATSAREAAKQTVMREKSFTEKRNKTRDENRTVIKGVRTNRRFELQMRMRNLD